MSDKVNSEKPPLSGDWVWALILVGAVVLAYLPLWQAGFIWDDNLFTSDNPRIVGPLGLKEIWTQSAAQFYPVVLSTFWLEHALWGLAPLGYHLMNIALHATSAVVLWRVLRNLEARGAWVGAALWALHPVQVETVAWIAELKNTESGLFFLLTILFFVKGLKTDGAGQRSGINGNVALALLCSAVAMSSKSSTLLLPFVLALCAWWVKGRWYWRDLAKVGLFALMAIVVGVIALHVIPRNGTNELQWTRSWFERLVMAGDIFWFYLGKLFWPYPLMTFYPRWDLDAGEWFSYLPLAALPVLLVILWLNRRSWSRPYFFAFAYYLMNLLPLMGLFSLTGFRYSPVEDHLQYLASMGPLALAGAGLAMLADFIARKPWLRPALCACLLLGLGILTWRQSSLYQSKATLEAYNLAHNPDCWLAYKGLDGGAVDSGQLDKVIEFYEKALAINPNRALTHENLGLAWVQKGQLDDAIAEYQKALAIDPGYAKVQLELGDVLLQKGQVDEAIAQYQKAVEINPSSDRAHNNLGAAYVQKGDADDAIAEYQKALAIDPNYTEVYNNLGLALIQKGEVDDAIALYQKALTVDPNSSLTHDNLGAAFFRKGEADEAIGEFQKAVAIDPNSEKAHNNLGMALGQKGEADQAMGEFQKALAIDPGYAEAHNNLGIAFARKGQLDEAQAQFQEALRLQPDDNAAQLNLTKIKALIQQKAAH
ncbi:MAG: tetratricopeptide repeat protein [Methylacidiphilales bacterium]|nr:tetratricopeptide repeat protein [Candidatus Methylacidiphilales bacterium]